MFDILFARTFLIVGAMLIITAITARVNKSFETTKESCLTFIFTFVFLIAVMIFADVYPLNLLLVGVFSALIGWQIGPAIERIGNSFKMKRYMRANGIVLAKNQKMGPEQLAGFERYLDSDQGC